MSASQTTHTDLQSGLYRSTSLFAKYYAPKRYEFNLDAGRGRFLHHPSYLLDTHRVLSS